MRYIAAFALLLLMFGAATLSAQAPPSSICAPVSGLPAPGTNGGLSYFVQPTSLDYGSVTIGSSATPQQFCISANTIAVFNISSSDQSQFPVLSSQSSTTTIGEYQLVNVGFAPRTQGALTASISVTSGGQIRTVTGRGQGVIPQQPPLANCTATLPNGFVGLTYQQALCASGGSGVYSWKISGALPPGLQLSGSTISGTPSQTGSYSFSATVSDTSSPPNNLTVPLAIVINPTLSICTPSLPAASILQSYQQQLCVMGGVPPYSLRFGGVPPPGLRISGTTISGTPTQSGTYSFSVLASDSSSPSQTAAQSLTLVVYSTLTITTTSLPNGSLGRAYQQMLLASGGSGVYTWRISSGTLPLGLSLVGSAIAGTPTQMGTFAFIVGVSDTAAQQQTASETLNLTISAVAAPVVTAVQDAESSLTTVVPGEWVAIYGRELAGTTRAWAAADFNNGNTLPTALDGVSVQFNGHSAAVYYVSPTQIDVQAPSAIQGNASVTVSFDGVTSAPIAAAVVQNAPSLFYYVAGTNLYAAATHADGTLIGDPLISGSTVSKSHPGETIVLYVNGLAASPGGTIITAPVAYTDPITVTVGGQTATVIYAGLVAAGEYQINVTLPDSLGTGDLPIMVQTVGQSSPAGVLLPAGPAGALRPEFEPRGHVSLSAGRGP